MKHQLAVFCAFLVMVVSLCASEVDRLLSMAQNGNAEAQYQLGMCYINGKGVPVDEEKAVFWFKKSAKSGYDEGQLALGNCYICGMGVKQDSKEGFKWHKKAAEQGCPGAQCNLGMDYENGYGVKKDMIEAVRWYRKAADQGHGGAQDLLGYCYYNGEGTTRDIMKAVELWRRSAEQGNPDGQYSYGICFLEGILVHQDTRQAIKWLRRAAEQGNEEAQQRLKYCHEDVATHTEPSSTAFATMSREEIRHQYACGLAYFETSNYKEAVKRFSLTASQGHAESQYRLGLCYLNGLGVPRNENEAKKWLRDAANQGIKEAAEILRNL